MSKTDSLPAMIERSSADETLNFLSYIEEDKFNFPYEELLLEPNNDFVNQTHLNRVNGTSNTLRAKSDLIVTPPFLRAARERFRAIQKWEGYVIEVGSETFLARLIPIVGEGSDQEAEIFLDELDEEDRLLIGPGAVFYWSIGYLDGPSGRRRNSIIRFRRLPMWTRRDLNRTRIQASKLHELLDSE